MWQEARKHERKLRGMMVDYKRRGERRREYYEKIKKDPAQFLQVHGRAYKIHLDSAVALAAESPINMMPWQGDANNMIDRFDVRAHLDYIPSYKPTDDDTTTPEQESEERKCNYERYRGLVQNDFANISEEQCLYQIYVDELYGGLQRPNEDEKKKLSEKKAQIGYTYDDSTVTEPDEPTKKGNEDDSENSESEEDEIIPDIDVEVDIDELSSEQVTEINKMGTTYGMADGDFVWMLRKDKDEVEAIKQAKALEAEKAMYSGRRSRRQRREFREKYMKGRQISPPSYARRDSPTYDPYKRPESDTSSESRSRSRTPGKDKITFITSFGGSDEEGATTTPAPPAAATSSFNTAGHSRGPRSVTSLFFTLAPFRRRTSSSQSSISSRSSSRQSSRSSSRSRLSRRSRGGRGRDSRYSRSRSRSRHRSDSRSQQRSGGYSLAHVHAQVIAIIDGVAAQRTGGVGVPVKVLPTHPLPAKVDHPLAILDYQPLLLQTNSESRPETLGGKETGAAKVSKNLTYLELVAKDSASLTPDRLIQLKLFTEPLFSVDLMLGLMSHSSICLFLKSLCPLQPKMTPQEKLKLRMQKALNKQSKADKKAAQAKIQQQENRRQEREGVLRAMARKIRINLVIVWSAGSGNGEKEREMNGRDNMDIRVARPPQMPNMVETTAHREVGDHVQDHGVLVAATEESADKSNPDT
ncbi:hypothetical protein DNTS_012365 [Danionella cerebrum]|uniref:Suppressor of white apricot N-terminal domain-containing protein n=1 Tax=Danionella cerebrum TaxID=2873325 RepID=A0A553R8J2_9TELE|nr:hypothetical protein DNTS_012365 [Danionella translucida]